MLKIIKYDLKIPIIVIFVFSLFTVLLNGIFIGVIQQSDTLTLVTYTLSHTENVFLINSFIYVLFVVTICGVMWQKVVSCTELYEMAGVSPLKVGAARMLLVFLSTALFSLVLTACETTVDKVTVARLTELSSDIDSLYYNSLDFSIFSVYRLPASNLLLSFFNGIEAAVFFSTAFAYATASRRIKSKFVNVMIFACLAVLLGVTYFGLLSDINGKFPHLDLNKLSMPAPLVIRYVTDAESVGIIMLHNMLNAAIWIFFLLYTGLMFAIYSIRRKAI